MNDRATVRPITVSIAAVERDTGLSKDTLRVWERRYGFPLPERDAFGERAYPLDQVEKLRIIKRLLDAGHRPGRVVSMQIDALQVLGQSLSAAPQSLAHGEHTDLRLYMDLVKSHDVEGLRRTLGQVGMRLGLAMLISEVIAPLNVMIGDAWMRGQLEVFEEHMYTESVNAVLRNAIAHIPASAATSRPRVLLSTFPQEPHGLGLLMAEAMLSLEGCRCLSLGTQTPIWDIVLAATAHRADIVALSFTASQNPNQVISGLEELRQKLPRAVGILVGGSCPIVGRKTPEGIFAASGFAGLASYIANWRAQHV